MLADDKRRDLPYFESLGQASAHEPVDDAIGQVL